MKFLILGATNTENTKDLIKEIKRRKHQVKTAKPSDFIFKSTQKDFKIFAGETDLSNFDIYLLRGYNKTLLESRIFAEKMLRLGKIVIDEAIGNIFIQSKLFEASKILEKALNYPQTYLIVDYKSFVKIKKDLKYPVIVKPRWGQKGQDIYKFYLERELDDFLKKGSKDWLIQEFLEIDGDVRVFIVGGEILGAIKRFTVEGDYRSNISLGAKAEIFKLDKDSRKIALEACKTMGYEIAGVDIAYSKGRWYVIEVNSTPQWQGFKKTTGVKPEKFIIDYAIKKYQAKK